MARQDLLALTPDDLIALSNRGIVKRAQREVEAGEAGAEVSEDADGNVMARWPDGAACRISPREKLSDGCCTCAATAVCRHLIGTILGYQAQTSKSKDALTAAESWDPGAIPDEALSSWWTAKQLALLRQQFDAGMVVELHRGARPGARLHSIAHSLRFLVPGDPRYTRCDCAEQAPCKHVPLAIWAFRLLAKGRDSGLVSTERESAALPSRLLHDIDRALDQLLDYGIADLPEALASRLERLESECRGSDLVWLAEILMELVKQRRQYESHDARFSPAQVAALIGELVIRADATHFPEQPVPQMFIRGSSAEATAEMGNARLIGLGTSVESRRSSVVVAAYLQDAATGVVVALPREFADPSAADVGAAGKISGRKTSGAASVPRAFSELGRTSIFKSANLAAVGAGQILVHGGKRSPNCEFQPGRSRAALNPQNYQWEQLRPPVLAGGFGDLLEQQRLRPHPCLRPRRLTEDLHVCAIAAVEDSRFNVREQSVESTLRDGDGQSATLVHPYHSRGRSGVEALMHHLRSSKLLFVAGKVRLGVAGVVIAPTGLVFGRDAGRWMLQPWISEEAAVSEAPADGGEAAPVTPLRRHLGELLDLIGECALVGRARVPERMWRDLRAQSKSLGLLQIPDTIGPASVLALSGLVVFALAGQSGALRYS